MHAITLAGLNAHRYQFLLSALGARDWWAKNTRWLIHHHQPHQAGQSARTTARLARYAIRLADSLIEETTK
jgi:hypothetical protein